MTKVCLSMVRPWIETGARSTANDSERRPRDLERYLAAGEQRRQRAPDLEAVGSGDLSQLRAQRLGVGVRPASRAPHLVDERLGRVQRLELPTRQLWRGLLDRGTVY